MDLKGIEKQAEQALKKAKTQKEARAVVKKFLGKQGEIAKGLELLKKLPPEQRKQQGKKLNLLKNKINTSANDKIKEIQEKAIQERIAKESLDVTRPGIRPNQGHLHPLTQVQEEACDIFTRMGFSVVLGPEVETEWHNFDALNIPKDHPARDMWDTFWVEGNLLPSTGDLGGGPPEPLRIAQGPEGNLLPSTGDLGGGPPEPLKIAQKSKSFSRLLLRAHTSPVQIRYLEKHTPPLRIVAPGKVFRNERTDASHDVQFYQMEGLMLDKDISVAHFKAIIQEFLKRFFKTEIDMRLRPSFFPFTEPSFEIDMRRPQGKWLEIMGAGMVHPNVLKATGHNPTDWQGFAFGVGLDRLAMLLYNINDIRLFRENDLRFLKQF